MHLGGDLGHGAAKPLKVSELVQAAGSPAVWNRTEALAALDYDEDLLCRLARVLCQDLRNREGHIEAAKNAGNSASLRRLAHAVKNSAGAMSFDFLCACADEAEKADDTALPASVERMRRAMREALLLLEAEPGCMQDSGKSAGSAGAEPSFGAASRKGEC